MLDLAGNHMNGTLQALAGSVALKELFIQENVRPCLASQWRCWDASEPS